LIEDLLDVRYTFEGSKKAVPAILAFSLSERDFQTMDDVDLRLVYGQLDAQEQTSSGFVQSVRTITVTSAQPQRLPSPEARQEPLTGGQYSVTFSSSNPNAKIYYTTDGSEPSVHSTMFNVSANHWQPQLNVPFTVGGDTQVKAISVATGFINSEVLSFIPDKPLELTAQETSEAPKTQQTPDTSADDSATAHTGFSDVPDSHWAANEINSLVERGIISGMGGGVFAPDRILTRAQFAALLVRHISGHELPASSAKLFNDVAEGSWYADIVAEAVRLGLFNGYADGNFYPDEPVSKEQMLAVAVRALPDGLSTAGEGASFFAANGISRWAKDSVEAAYRAGLVPPVMLGSEDGLLTLDGAAEGIRAEAAYVIYHLIILKAE
jgi:hypothetical protein